MPHFAVLRPYKICVQCHKLLISLRFLHNPITIVSEYVIILHLFIPTGAIRKRQELLFLAVRRTKWTEAQRAEVIHPVSHNSVTGPEIKPLKSLQTKIRASVIYVNGRILQLCIWRQMVDQRKTRGRTASPEEARSRKEWWRHVLKIR